MESVFVLPALMLVMGAAFPFVFATAVYLISIDITESLDKEINN